jgi:hypothetical protein
VRNRKIHHTFYIKPPFPLSLPQLLMMVAHPRSNKWRVSSSRIHASFMTPSYELWLSLFLVATSSTNGNLLWVLKKRENVIVNHRTLKTRKGLFEDVVKAMCPLPHKTHVHTKFHSFRVFTP